MVFIRMKVHSHKCFIRIVESNDYASAVIFQPIQSILWTSS